MDLETIRQINRDALKAAQNAQAGEGGFQMNNQQMIMYAVAVAAAVAAFFLMKYYMFDFVTTTENGQKQFDQTRAIIASIVVGLAVILGYHLFQQ